MFAATRNASTYALMGLVLAACGAEQPRADADTCTPGEPLRWNTFQGGLGTDYGNSIALDGAGGMLVCGMSNATWGRPVRAFGDGNWDAVVARLTTDGALLWNTFLGDDSAAADSCASVAFMPAGEVAAAGRSTDPWGTPVRAFSGGAADAFVARLDAQGRVVWTTFLGGRAEDEGLEVATDAAGNVFIAGSSAASWGAPRATFGGDTDGFVAKLDPQGNVVWNTFLGGRGADVALTLAVEADGSVLVAGHSSAAWGAPMSPYIGGTDGFVAKLSATGDLAWNRFLGGTGLDEARSLSLASDGAWVAGLSETSWGVPGRAFSGGGLDGFIARLERDGSLRSSTFLGGAGEDVADSLVADGRGGVYASGFSRATWGTPMRAFLGGNSDAWAARVDATGSLVWNTFLGSPGGAGPDDDYGNAVASTTAGAVFVTGDSDARWGEPLRDLVTGSHDLFVARVDEPCAEPPRVVSVGCDCGTSSGALPLWGVVVVWRRRGRHAAQR